MIKFLSVAHYAYVFYPALSQKYLAENIKVFSVAYTSELLAMRINKMSDEDYAQYLRYHFYICEKPEMIGMTNHLLFVGEKR